MQTSRGGGGGRGGGGFRGGGGGGRGGGGFRGGGGGGGRNDWNQGPPSKVDEYGIFQTPCEGQLVFMATNKTMVPKFNKPVYTRDIQQVGKIDEIFGPTSQVFFSVKPDTGIQASSWKVGDKIYMADFDLLQKSRFTDPPKPRPSGGGRPGGRGRGGGRGGGGFKSGG